MSLLSLKFSGFLWHLQLQPPSWPWPKRPWMSLIVPAHPSIPSCMTVIPYGPTWHPFLEVEKNNPVPHAGKLCTCCYVSWTEWITTVLFCFLSALVKFPLSLSYGIVSLLTVISPTRQKAPWGQNQVYLVHHRLHNAWHTVNKNPINILCCWTHQNVRTKGDVIGM